MDTNTRAGALRVPLFFARDNLSPTLAAKNAARVGQPAGVKSKVANIRANL